MRRNVRLTNIRSDRGEIWFSSLYGGFRVLKFRDGVWPFPGTPKCPAVHDYYFNQYNPLLACN